MYLIVKNTLGNVEYNFVSERYVMDFGYQVFCNEAYNECFDGVVDLDNSVEVYEIDDVWLYDMLERENLDDFLVKEYRTFKTDDGFEWVKMEKK